MNPWILISAGLSAVTVLLHVLGGGTEVHAPMLASELSVILKAYSSVLWHAVTIVLVINSLALLVAAFRVSLQKPLVLLAAWQYLGFAILFGIYGMTRLGSLMPMPQWIIFCLIVAPAVMGLKRGSQMPAERVQA